MEKCDKKFPAASFKVPGSSGQALGFPAASLLQGVNCKCVILYFSLISKAQTCGASVQRLIIFSVHCPSLFRLQLLVAYK
jgi:hypothetical protein